MAQIRHARHTKHVTRQTLTTRGTPSTHDRGGQARHAGNLWLSWLAPPHPTRSSLLGAMQVTHVMQGTPATPAATPAAAGGMLGTAATPVGTPGAMPGSPRAMPGQNAAAAMVEVVRVACACPASREARPRVWRREVAWRTAISMRNKSRVTWLRVFQCYTLRPVSAPWLGLGLPSAVGGSRGVTSRAASTQGARGILAISCLG